jgi:glycosyltransferase involved in cell wall biosynthesis
MDDMKKNKILVFNLEISGVNKYLFSQLEQKGWKLLIIDVPVPKICIILALIFSFRPDILQWERKFKQNIGKFAKLPWAFKARTKFCQRKIMKMNGKFDIIFQISGMFSPTLDYLKLKTPYVTFNDYTMALANKYPDDSTSQSQMTKWFSLEKELYQNATIIFTTSENTRNSMIHDYAIEPTKIITVRYGSKIDAIPKYEKNYANKTILFLGKSFEKKGGFVLLKAFQKVREEIPDAKLIIAGVKKEFLKIKQPGVNIFGYINDKEKIQNLYKEATIFVMPSFSEAFGLVFLEAMGFKLPCIGTNVDAMPEIIEDGVTGFLVPPKDDVLLSEKLITLLKNPELCVIMGLAGYKKLQKEFSWDSLGDEMDLNLKKIIN